MKTDQILEGLQRNTSRQPADEQLAAPKGVWHELQDLFDGWEPETNV